MTRVPQNIWVLSEAYNPDVYDSSKEGNKQKQRKHTSLPQPLNDVKPFRVLTAIRTHTSSRAIVELNENGWRIPLVRQTRASTNPNSSRLTESYACRRSTKHIHMGIVPALPTSRSRRTSNSLPTLHRPGQKPHRPSRSIPLASQKSPRQDATRFSKTLPYWATTRTSQIPRYLLQ